jgi:hypothetical protein
MAGLITKRSPREKLIALITFLAGLYFFLEFVLPKKLGEYEFGKYHEQISNGFAVVGSMAIGLGLINLLTVHGSSILKQRRGWPFSLALLLGLAIMMNFEIATFVHSERAVAAWQKVANLGPYADTILSQKAEKPAQPRIEAAYRTLEVLQDEAQTPESWLYSAEEESRQNFLASLSRVEAEFKILPAALALSVAAPQATDAQSAIAVQPALKEAVSLARTQAQEITKANLKARFEQRGSSFLYNAFFVPLGAAMFSLLAFYVANAAYRTFRIRSLEAGIMMTAALIVMLGQIPHGPMLISPQLVPLRLWLLEQLSTPAFRAIYFGSAIAGLAMAVRMWLSLERSPLDSE